MRQAFIYLFVFLFVNQACAQDTLYARQVIKYLTSESCLGRGYVKKGLQTAEAYICHELKQNKLQPLFGKSFTQSFFHPVNTFPKACELSVNGKKLVPGLDFIVDPSSCSMTGTFKLQSIDSTHFIQVEGSKNISLSFKDKLTYSVGRKESNFCGFELDRARFKEMPKDLVVNVQNKFIPHFKSKNIGAFIAGTGSSDSCIVFSAHYDHLGAMGKRTFFPGANDNASGVSFVLNLMNYYVTHPPKYKTVFLLFAGEEAGLLGSQFFVESKALDLKKIKFLINLDLLGTGSDGIMVVNGALYEKEFKRLHGINATQNLLKEIKKRGKAANSDHYWFSEAGVPCFFIYTMGGIKAYHDVFDIAKTLPLTKYVDVFKLLVDFTAGF